MNTIKNQHYIPESLLWHFTDYSGKFFEVLLDVPKIYKATPGNSMSEMFTYEHEKLEVNTIETFLARIDAEVASQMQELIDTIPQIKMGEKNFLVAKERIEKMLHQLLVFYYRSGALLTEFGSFKKDDKVPLLTKKIMNVDYIYELAKIIKNSYNFALIESDQDFLMSDQFISTAATKIKARFFNVSNRHMGLVETMILIPITSSIYGVYWHSSSLLFQPNAINLLNERQIQLINQAIINNSYIKSICPKRERIEQALEQFKFALPSQIFAGGNPNGYMTSAIKKKEVFYDPVDRAAFDMLELAGFAQYTNLGRNNLCGCKSGIKFKKCHEETFNRIKPVIASLGDKSQDYRIPGVYLTELPVDSWSGFSKENT